MSYSCKNDVCLPKDLTRVGIFKGLQRAINDVLDASRAADEQSPGPVSWKLGMYVDKVVVDGRIGPLTVAAARDLALNIEPVRHAFREVVFDAASVAAIAGPLGKAFADVAAASYKPAAMPAWLWAISPPATFAWARRSYKAK